MERQHGESEMFMFSCCFVDSAILQNNLQDLSPTNTWKTLAGAYPQGKSAKAQGWAQGEPTNVGLNKAEKLPLQPASMQVHYLPSTCHVQMEILRQGQKRRDAETGSTEPRLFRQFLMWVDPLRQHQAICVALHSGVGFHQHHRHPLELARLNRYQLMDTAPKLALPTFAFWANV